MDREDVTESNSVRAKFDAADVHIPHEVARWRAAALVLLLSTTSLLFIGFFRPGAISAGLAAVTNTKPEPAPSPQVNPLEEPSLPITLPFGAAAKQTCNQSCFKPAVDRKICMDRCERLLVSEFARRISPPAPPAQDSAAATVAACEGTVIKTGTPAEIRLGMRRAATVMQREANDPTYNRTQALRRYQQAERAQAHLRIPQDSSDDAAIVVPALAQALCARQIAAASELAVIDRVLGGDLYSELYFRDFEAAVLGQLSTLEQRADALVSTLSPADSAIDGSSAEDLP